MAALTVRPGVAESGRLERGPPYGGEGIEVETLLVGVCGTDFEIVGGAYGSAAPGRERLVIGHEAVGRVVEAGEDSGFAPGDLVVPIVRRPDPVPCASCAVGEWDMCQNGQYTEHGIKGADGFARDRFPLDPSYAVAVPDELGEMAVLTEPASIMAKAWEHIERIGARAHWSPARVLVTGAGPIGLLAALMARQRGFEVAVFDRATAGPKPDLVAGLGASYHIGDVEDAMTQPDVILECTGAASVVFDVIGISGPTGIVCLAGISSGHRSIEIDADAINRQMVLENDVVFGTVNANRRHYQAAVEALVAADASWLKGIISRRVPLEEWEEAFDGRLDDVKVALDLG
jgi:threonine dehydrogenase-like Zn-dependent dehydrogenase